jgi:hypothetical protein
LFSAVRDKALDQINPEKVCWLNIILTFANSLKERGLEKLNFEGPIIITAPTGFASREASHGDFLLFIPIPEVSFPANPPECSGRFTLEHAISTRWSSGHFAKSVDVDVLSASFGKRCDGAPTSPRDCGR